MEPMEIATSLRENFPDEVLQVYTFHGQTGVIVKRDRILSVLRWLRDTPKIEMNHLMDLCGVDNKKRGEASLQRFEVVYNLYSISCRHNIRIRAQVPEEDPRLDSATPLWPGADWHERECYDLMGIHFTGHPNLQRILLPETWEGHPLRKEYPLRGKEEWTEMDGLLRQVENLRQFGFQDETDPKDDSGSSTTDNKTA